MRVFDGRVYHSLDFAHCIHLIQVERFHCSISHKLEVGSRGLLIFTLDPFGNTVGVVMYFHQEAQNILLLLFL